MTMHQLAQSLSRVTYEDDAGRRWAMLVPPGREDDAAMGIVLGPPDTSGLGLPEETAVRLHNELFSRGLLTLADLRGRQAEVFSALQAAYRTDAVRVMSLYQPSASSDAGEG